MKTKLLLSLLLTQVFFVLKAYEVPTTLQKKNILLEEFTGINCGNCPRGHNIANILLTAKPENAFTIAIHSGSYAKPASDQPDFRTDKGEELDVELGAFNMGYPCGTVNRHAFEGTALITGTGSWIKDGKAIHAEDSPVNLWMRSEFNGSTRNLKVNVEGYYTKQVEETFNLLNLAITQSNIQGPQSGGGVGSDYIHKHMLRDFITPMWGDTIKAPKQGEYFIREYNYTLPENLKGIEVKPEDIELILFICKDKREVLNVIGGKPEYKEYNKSLKATVLKPEWTMPSRYGYNFFPIRIKNESDKEITRATFEVTIGEEKQDVEWTGSISSFETLPIEIKVEPYTIAASNNYEIALVAVNGESVAKTAINGSLSEPLISTNKISIQIQTDLYADENIFTIKDQDGNVVKEFGPYETDKKAVYEESAELEPDKIYCFEILDEWGDGIQNPRGFYKLYNDDKTMIAQGYDIKQYGERVFFKTSALTSIPTIEKPSFVSIISEPVGKMIEIKLFPSISGQTDITIFSVQGVAIERYSASVVSGEIYSKRLSLENYPGGIYMIVINQGQNITVEKFIIH